MQKLTNLAGKCLWMRPHFLSAEPWTVSETGRWFLCCPLWWQWCISQFLAPVQWLAGSMTPLSQWQLGRRCVFLNSLVLCSLVVCCLLGCRSLLDCNGAQIVWWKYWEQWCPKPYDDDFTNNVTQTLTQWCWKKTPPRAAGFSLTMHHATTFS